MKNFSRVWEEESRQGTQKKKKKCNSENLCINLSAAATVAQKFSFYIEIPIGNGNFCVLYTLWDIKHT